MSSLSRELVFLILQFLDEEKFKETVHKYAYSSLILLKIFIFLGFCVIYLVNNGDCGCERLEQESGFFFNMRYFEDMVTNGEWEEVEKYLSGFTKVDDNRYSMKIFFEIRKQKYLEALDKYVCFFLNALYWILDFVLNYGFSSFAHFDCLLLLVRLLLSEKKLRNGIKKIDNW